MKTEIEYLYPKKFIAQAWTESTDEEVLSIFWEAKSVRGLEKENIVLLTPEDADYCAGNELGFSWGNKEKGYAVGLTPKLIEISERSLEHVIHHELTHVEKGDCDRKLPYIIKMIYNLLIAEPRASRIAERYC